MSEEDNASNYDTDNNIVNDSIEEELLDAATGSKEVTVAASTELLVAASTDSKEPSDPSSPGPEISRPKSKEKLLDESLEKSINTKENIRPRSQCDGGTKQLKLKNQTKGSAPNCTVKERALARINKKVGEDKSAELKARWDEIQHQKQKPKKEIQSECDGMIKTLLSLGFSKVEVTTFLCVGGPRVNRIMAAILNPPVDEPTSKPPAHAATEGDIKRVLEYITMLDLEPGYPCAHKKIPLYVVGEHQGFSWKQLHSEYEKKCLEDHARVLSCNRFREYVQHYIPAIKLGKTQTDLCNECYTISIQLKNPDISDEEKSEMKLKLSMHLDEANIQRRAMNAYITAVKSKIAPNDPPFRFEPCYIPEVEDEILGDALNLFKHSRNPALDLNDDGISDLETDQVETDQVEPEKGATNISSTNVLFLHTVWVDNANSSQVNNNSGDALRKDENKEHMEVTDKDEEENLEQMENNNEAIDRSSVKLLTMRTKEALVRSIKERNVGKRDVFADTLDQNIVAKMDLEIEDYGQEKLLPSFKLRRPGADYFNSSLNIRNMNFINPTAGGQSKIYLYDERIGGKGGDEVCSIRWHNLTSAGRSRIDNMRPQPLFHVSILDNCTGQNKSNSAFKFEAMTTVLGIFKTKTKLFLKPGHSHNQSDVITGESTRHLRKKDLFTIDQLCTEMNASKNVTVSVLHSEQFFKWENFLNKHFKDLPLGFTKFYCYEFSEGCVAMKRLCTESSEEEAVVKQLVKDPVNARKVILEELLGLPPTASLQEILKAKLRLPKLPEKLLKPKKLESLSKKYSCIPTEYLSYYPGGDDYKNKLVADPNIDEDQDTAPVGLVGLKPKKGRPKVVVNTPKNTQSILRFLCTPKIQAPSKADDYLHKNPAPFGAKTLKFKGSNRLQVKEKEAGDQTQAVDASQVQLSKLTQAREASKQTQDREVSKAVEDIKGSKPKQVKKKRGIVEYIESTGEKRFIQNYVLLTALIQVWKIQTKRLF